MILYLVMHGSMVIVIFAMNIQIAEHFLEGKSKIMLIIASSHADILIHLMNHDTFCIQFNKHPQGINLTISKEMSVPVDN